MVPAIVLQRSSANLTARVWQNPRIVGRIIHLPAEAEIRFGNVRFGVLRSAFGAVPEGGVGGCGGRDREASGSACGGKVRGLAGPALDADEVEDGIAEGGA